MVSADTFGPRGTEVRALVRLSQCAQRDIHVSRSWHTENMKAAFRLPCNAAGWPGPAPNYRFARQAGTGFRDSPQRGREVCLSPTHTLFVWVRCGNLVGVGRNRCVAHWRLRRGRSRAGPHRPFTALGRPHRWRCRVDALLASSRCGGRAPRSASPPDGWRPRIPASPSVKRLPLDVRGLLVCATSACPPRASALGSAGSRAAATAARSDPGASQGLRCRGGLAPLRRKGGGARGSRSRRCRSRAPRR